MENYSVKKKKGRNKEVDEKCQRRMRKKQEIRGKWIA